MGAVAAGGEGEDSCFGELFTDFLREDGEGHGGCAGAMVADEERALLGVRGRGEIDVVESFLAFSFFFEVELLVEVVCPVGWRCLLFT